MVSKSYIKVAHLATNFIKIARTPELMGAYKFAGILLVLAFLIVPSSFAYIITGTILDEFDEPVSGSVVAIHYYTTHGLLRETVSNDRGIFRLEIPSRENTYYVRIEHPAFQIFEEPYFFTMYEEVREIDLNVYLEPPILPQIEHYKGRMRIFADMFPKQAPNPFIGLGIIAIGAILGLILRKLK